MIRVEIPSRKISRIYSSEKASIAPTKDGEFVINTAILNLRPEAEQANVEILKLTHETPKK